LFSFAAPRESGYVGKHTLVFFSTDSTRVTPAFVTRFGKNIAHLTDASSRLAHPTRRPFNCGSDW
jgi:hypothetical protein